MSTVAEIESAIKKLDPVQLSLLSKWFDDYVEKTWDERIERDAKAGKLEHLRAEVTRARDAGGLIDFP